MLKKNAELGIPKARNILIAVVVFTLLQKRDLKSMYYQKLYLDASDKFLRRNYTFEVEIVKECKAWRGAHSTRQLPKQCSHRKTPPLPSSSPLDRFAASLKSK